MDRDFLEYVEQSLHYPLGYFRDCKHLKEVLIKAYNRRKDASQVVYILEAWDKWRGGFNEETTKVEVPADIWEKLNDLD